MSYGKNTRRNVNPALIDTTFWSPIDVDSFGEERRQLIKSRVDALSDYLAGKPISQRLKQLGVSHKELLKIFQLSISLAPDGQPYGWRAAIPGIYRKSYERKKPTTAANGSAGALIQTFKIVPGLREKLEALILKRRIKNHIHEARIANKDIHKVFLEECRAAGIRATQWPFTARYLGIRSIDKFVNQVINSNPERAARVRFGNVAGSKMGVGTGHEALLLAYSPFDVAEMDCHRLDFIGTVQIDTPTGKICVPIERIQLLLIADGTGAILGYYAVIRREANATNILQAAECLVIPWKPRSLTVDGMSYRPGSGLPLGTVDGMKSFGVCALLVDNALINLSHAVVFRLVDRLGCAVNWGPTRKWMRRPLIERINKTLEDAGFQRLASTTGSHPKDPRRNNPSQTAVEIGVDFELVLDLIDVQIALYNDTPSEGRFGLKPLDVIRQTVEGVSNPTLLPWLPPPGPETAELDVLTFRATIRGNLARGDRPSIRFERGRYTNPVISSNFNLIGEEVILHVRQQNIQTLEVYLARTGESLGIARVLGPWRRTPHSLELRKQINRHIAETRFDPNGDTDPVTSFHRYLAQQATKKGTKKRKTTSAEGTTLARERRATKHVVEWESPSDRVTESSPTVVPVKRAPRFGRGI